MYRYVKIKSFEVDSIYLYSDVLVKKKYTEYTLIESFRIN